MKRILLSVVILLFAYAAHAQTFTRSMLFQQNQQGTVAYPGSVSSFLPQGAVAPSPLFSMFNNMIQGTGLLNDNNTWSGTNNFTGTVTGISSSLIVGTSPITGSCTSGYDLYNNSGLLGCQTNGAGSNFGVLVTASNVGMASGGANNSTKVAALMTALGTPANGGSAGVFGNGNLGIFPAVAGAGVTPYYFDGSLWWSRASNVNCWNSGQSQTVVLVFEAGYDGLVFDSSGTSIDGGSASGATGRGCEIASLGSGTGDAEPGASTIVNVAMNHYGSIGPSAWAIGDGIMAAPQGQHGRTQMLSLQPGAYISSVSGTTIGLASGYTTSGYPFGPINAGTVTGTITNSVLNVTAGSNIVVGEWLFNAAQNIYFQIASLGTGSGGIGTYNITSPAIASQTSTSYVGVMTMTASISGTSITVTNLNGGTIVRDLSGIASTYLTDIFPLGYGGTIPAGTYFVSQQSGTPGGNGVYTLSNSVSYSGQAYGGQIQFGTIGNAQQSLIRLPLSLMYNVTTASGSNTVTVTGGPPICLTSGDQLWADAFLYGAQINTTTCNPQSGPTYPYTITVVGVAYSFMNASVTHTSGSGQLWKIPSGISKRTNANTQDMSVTGFGMGDKQSCSTGSTPELNCSSFRIINDFVFNNFIGSYTNGNNAGGSSIINLTASLNYVGDVLEMGSVANSYVNLSLNSYEGGYGPLGAAGTCAGAASLFNGGYITGYSGAPAYVPGDYCMPTSTGAFVIPDGTGGGLGYPIFISPEANVPNDAFNYQSGLFRGPSAWIYSGTATSNFTYSGSAITSGTNPGIYGTWLFNGMSITDLTNPGAIPAGTTITNVSTSVLTMSNAVQNPPGIQSGDLIQVSTVQVPCFSIKGGMSAVFGWGAGTSGCSPGDYQFGFDGNHTAWGLYNPAKISLGDFLFAQNGVYAGYNATAAGEPIAPAGIEISANGNSFGAERMFDFAASAPSYGAFSYTAAQAFLSTNSVLALTGGSCTTVFAEYSLVDTTVTNVLGTISDCLTTTNWITLTSTSSIASTAKTDILSFAGGAIESALDVFGTTQTMIPINGSCTNATGAVTDSSQAGASVGTVSSCGTSATVFLRRTTGHASSGASDALRVTNGLQGNLRINNAPVAGGNVGWLNTTNGAGPLPFGIVQDTTPAISSCGTSPSIVAGSTNVGGSFVLGTGTPTACTITFTHAYPNHAFCTFSPSSSGGAAISGGDYITQSSSGFTLTLGTGTSSLSFTYTCFGD